MEQENAAARREAAAENNEPTLNDVMAELKSLRETVNKLQKSPD